MKMDDLYMKICRICVEQNGTETRILSDIEIHCENATLSMQNVLKDLVGFQILDDSSASICSDCIKQATDSIGFKFLCQKSSEKYQKYFESIKIVNECIKIEPSESDSETIYIKDEDFSDDDVPLVHLANNVSENVSLGNFKHVEKRAFVDKPDKNKIKNNNKSEVKVNRIKKKQNIIVEDDEILGDPLKACKFCNKLFRSKNVLFAHEKRHENKGKFICNVCGKAFDSKGCLSRHSRVHTGEKNYQCKECQRYFPSANNLRLHARRHTGIKPYLCTQCGKSFIHPTGLSYHLRTHNRERPYTCEICGKSFLIQCHLDRHKKIHTGERPFACTQCKKAFIKKIDLQRHEAIHSGDRPHICKICNKAFLRPLHLNYHMMVHTSERPHKCIHCGKGFIRRYYLTDHIKKRHSDSPEDFNTQHT